MPSLIPALENDLDFEMIDTTTDLELTILEDLLNDECKCESLTHKDEGTVCSVKVTHFVSTVCGMGDKLLCQVAANTLQGHINSGRIRCAYCNHRAHNCWSIRPV